MTRFTPSHDQLKDTLEHIYYEIAQLTGTMRSTNNVAVNNALVESRLIHVRALLDFFQKTARGNRGGRELDDVLSSDYGFPSQEVDIPSQYQERLNKDLAHLTYSRSQRLPEDKPWPHDQVIAPILERCRQFGEHLIANHLATNCPEKIQEWEMLVSKIKAM